MAIVSNLIASSERSSSTDPLLRLVSQGVARQENTAVPTLSPQAVQQSAQIDSIDLASQSLAELQALIERLNESTSTADVESALTAIADFAKSSSANFLGDTVDKLASLAGDILEQIPQGSTGASFSFNASVSQAAFSSADYYKKDTAISFSFSYQDATTQFEASGNFADSLELNANSLSYQSYEQVSLSITTANVDLASNSALAAFTDLTKQFTDQVQSLFGASAPESAPATSNGGYRTASILDVLQLQFENLRNASGENESLLEALKALFADSEEVLEPQAA